MTEYTAPLPNWRPALALCRFVARYPLRVTFPMVFMGGFPAMRLDTAVHDFHSGRQHALEQMSTRVVTTSREASSHFAHALLNHHPGDVEATLEALALESGFEAAALVDDAGRVRAASGKRELDVIDEWRVPFAGATLFAHSCQRG